MSDIILKVEDIHLSYKFYKAKALRHFIFQKERRGVQTFEALKGVSFSIERGENLGIIGSNGSGKSTLLRVLAHTLTPDKGKITNKAKSVSLLSLGVGFQPELSGVENIYLNGLLLGLSRKQIEKRISDIVAFAEIGDFISNPVRTYSSGMKSRLSFSIAINVDPDLLLIDELFSVGDEQFKKKSRQRMVSMIEDNRTVVMVSHDLSQIRGYCHQVLWIENGIVKMFGNTDETVGAYISYNEKK